ncbi:vitamin-D-receptor interacting mediator subunit 4-domain-containing protein [Geopyxis carbonaria]|nr:vitamin-D-receptor interacting mediator subunit 4-domain-containing protein [Geopyxis carbonaria]
MNTHLQSSLTTLETHLTTLLDSISIYSPSPAAAASLIAADESLTSSLEVLSQHQSAYRRIQQLRATAAALDDRLSDTLTLLGDVRASLPAPALTAATAGRGATGTGMATVPVAYDELLAYASRIAKFSQPPNLAAFARLVAPPKPADTADPANPDAANPDAANPTDAADAADAEPAVPLGLTPADVANLDPAAASLFVPWPSEEQMKTGSLRAVGDGAVVEDMLSFSEREALEKERARARGEVVDGEEGGKEEEGSGEGRRVTLPVQREKAAISLSLDLYDPEDE